MTTPADNVSTGAEEQGTAKTKKRKGLISPTSSFVDFTELESEFYSEEGRQQAKYYNPHKMRQIKKPVTNLETCVHLLKGSVGAGMLAMPVAFHNAGVVIGIVGSILLGALCIYSMHVLLTMQYVQCKRLQVPFLTLPRSMRIAFLNGPKPLKAFACCAPYFVDFFLVAFQVGICSAYIIFIAGEIRKMAQPDCSDDDSSAPIAKCIDRRLYMLMIFIFIVLINFVRNLKMLTPFSIAGNFLIVVALCGIFYFVFKDPIDGKNIEMVAPVSTWPLFMGSILFALEAVGVIIALEHNMKTPENFLGWRGIFPWSLVGVVTLYIAVGLLGYLKFGDKFGDEDNDTIVAVLPNKGTWVPMAIRIIYCAILYFTYPLQCYVSLEIIWGNYLVKHIKDHRKECMIEYALRVSVVILTYVIAVVVPKVDILISLVGALCISFLGVIFPFVLELCTLWPDELGRWRYILYKDIVLIIVGFFMLFVGTYCSLYKVYTMAEKSG